MRTRQYVKANICCTRNTVVPKHKHKHMQHYINLLIFIGLLVLFIPHKIIINNSV